nr:hypothetical protein [Tanacetum cinerariifolium]
MVIQNKHDEENTVIRNKTRLVVRGYRQEEGIVWIKASAESMVDELSTFLLQNGLSKGIIDPTLFTRRFNDDILVVNQSPSGIFINQSKYVHEILKKYGLNTCDIVGTPMDIKHKLDLDQIGTQTIYQAHPTEKNLKEVKRIFPYLRGTVNMGLWYTKDSGFELTRFLDADYAGCKDTFKSTYGGAQLLGQKLNLRDLPKDTPIDRLEVLWYDIGKRSNVRMGIMSIETELTLEQTRQVMMEIVLEPSSNKILIFLKENQVCWSIERYMMRETISLQATSEKEVCSQCSRTHQDVFRIIVRRKIMISSFIAQMISSQKIKILDHKHAEGTAKNSQGNKVLRLKVKTYAMTTP